MVLLCEYERMPLAFGAMRRNTLALVGLAALALTTIVLVILSFLHVRPDPASITAVPGDAGAVQPAPTQVVEPRPSTVANIREALDGDEPMVILVLGDATGMDDGTARATRWVSRWAEELAEERPVTVAVRQSDGEFGPAEEFGEGEGTPIEIRNASNQPSRMVDVLAQAPLLITDDVDLVVMSFGHSEQAAEIAGQLDELWDRVPPQTMGLVMAQNPQRGGGAAGQQSRVEAVTAWAEENELPLVDVFNAFLDAPEPLSQLLGRDQINPSERGSQIWTEAIVDALEAE